MLAHQSSEAGQAVEVRADVLALATEWFSAFERRFLPHLAAKCGAAAAAAGGDGNRDEGRTQIGGGFAPQPISRILSEVRLRDRVRDRSY